MQETAVHPKTLQLTVQQLLGAQLRSSQVALDELTIVVTAADYFAVMQTLQTNPLTQFDQLMDLCAVDYSAYKGGAYEGPRFAVVSHLLSTTLNQRVRVKVFCADDDFPSIPSVNSLWNAANWFEREAFDLFGVVFEGHEDLRRILTDYGFIGHPFRKDFPISGHVEMRYDDVQKRVIYQPVTIDPRENIPRIIREETFGGVH